MMLNKIQLYDFELMLLSSLVCFSGISNKIFDVFIRHLALENLEKHYFSGAECYCTFNYKDHWDHGLFYMLHILY